MKKPFIAAPWTVSRATSHSKVRLIVPMLLGLSLITVGCTKPQEPTDSPVAQQPVQPTMPAQPAAAGVGKQGATLMDDTQAQRIITGPAIELFRFQQRAVFDIQIPKALELYKALNGQSPKNHQEFVREILQANQINLPELQAGMVYRFNAEKQQLWVYPEKEAPPEK